MLKLAILRRVTLRMLVLLLLAGALLFTVTHYQEETNLASLQVYLRQYGSWASLVFIIIYVIATISFIPGTLLTLAGGLLFGIYWGTLYSVIGSTLGAGVAFVIARHLAADWVMKRSGTRLQFLLRGVNQGGWRFVAVLRLVPITPFNVLNYIFGVTPIRFSTFIVPSLIFTIPGTMLFTYLGTLGHNFLAGDTYRLITKSIFVFAAFLALTLLPYGFRQLRPYYQIRK